MSSKAKKEKIKKASNKAPMPEESTNTGPEQQAESLEKFEEELVWCIEQIQMGLETQNPSSRQAQEATKVLKILLSAKAPMIKKRQAMRHTFGDYRKKMADEEKKSDTAMKKARMSSVPLSNAKKSTFFKKSVSKTGSHSGSTEPGDMLTGQGDVLPTCDCDSTEQSKSQSLPCGEDMKLNSDFQFNFKISDTNTAVQASEKVLCNQIQSSASNEQDPSFVSSSVFVKSDNSFKFRFEIDS